MSIVADACRKGREMKGKRSVIDMAYIALFVAFITLSSWISIPFAVPFTLQTFAVMLCAAVLGPLKSAIAVAAYILLGMMGVPVFSSFGGGISHLFGATGGYILGFLPSAVVTGLIMKLNPKNKKAITFLAMLGGNLVCYLCGCCYFAAVYASTSFLNGIYLSFITCVIPYIIPDMIKLALGATVYAKLQKIMKRA